ncbi:hybrid sensor histidine kinase/response regulator [Flavihumibacter fluvii]|uniref:hybrid sensor histidine kinase/response regulator n=1 Tax=Flavihumibacter fluvii TaxID=2838157 RepID=UPI001BDEB12C|nr:hybrid sensor histidine kinase/response regulator [Flavihumibacter fluvii]ULQ51879.1 ATP-binding protein [Flavihumibacter fluvii]
MSPFLQKTTRILIVDDDEDDFFITSQYILDIEEGKFYIEWAKQFNEALELMRDHAFDIYFIDYRLGAKTGVELLQLAIEAKCEEPIILLTGKGNREIDRLAMKIGAFDYLVKSELNTEKLERTIRYALERSSYINAIRKNERKFRNIFEQSLDAVFITDINLQFRELNKASNELFGYSSETLLLMHLPDLLEDQLLGERLKHYLESGQDVNDLEMDIITASGDKRTCILSATVETDLEGKHYIQGLLHDISNLKKTEWLTLQAEKLAATGRLVRTLAHEVRNPLNNITLSADQLLQENTDQEAGVYMDVIRRNAQRISNIITQLLNSSRQAEIEVIAGTIQLLLEEVLAEAADSITLKEVALVKLIQEGPLTILSDHHKLKIAFMNIIVNAIEAMNDKNDAKLMIRVSGKNGYAITEITDNGCGISPESMGRLFEPYYTSKRNGMGLGLASTMNIIQSHKGFIEVNSEVGRGTTFSVYLPLHEE